MVIPIVASISRDLFLSVPRDIQDGASALGATRWEVVRGVVLPSTASGVIAASLLGLGRALGEAIAVTQVIGAGSEIHASLFETGDTLAARIANQFPGAITELHKASLFYLGVILLVIGLVIEPLRAVDRQALRPPAGRRRDERGEPASIPTAPLTPTGNLRRRQIFSRVAESRRDGRRAGGGRRAGRSSSTRSSSAAPARSASTSSLKGVAGRASARRSSAPLLIVAHRHRDRDAARRPDRALPDRVRRRPHRPRAIRLVARPDERPALDHHRALRLRPARRRPRPGGLAGAVALAIISCR